MSACEQVRVTRKHYCMMELIDLFVQESKMSNLVWTT